MVAEDASKEDGRPGLSRDNEKSIARRLLSFRLNFWLAALVASAEFDFISWLSDRSRDRSVASSVSLSVEQLSMSVSRDRE